MSSPNKQPIVSGSAVMAAGLASAIAAAITSRFGVAGTLIGAALTTMIITGGAAILKAYLERISGRVRKVPGKLRRGAYRRGRRGAPHSEPASPVQEEQTIPQRPDLKNNFMGRLRGAFDWFIHLPLPRRRSILVGSVVPAIVAFVIAIGAVTGVELGIGNSLSCAIWSNCSEVTDASGTPSRSTTLGRLAGGGGPPANDVVPESQQGIDPQQQTPSGVEPAEPGTPVTPQTPSDSEVPAQEIPDQQVPSQPTPSQPQTPVDPSATPSQQPSGGAGAPGSQQAPAAGQ